MTVTPKNNENKLEEEFVDGDVDDIEESLILKNDISILNGIWEEIRELSESKDAILEKSGIGAIKRRVLSKHLGKVKIELIDNRDDLENVSQQSFHSLSHPQVCLTGYYPLGVTKVSTFEINGKEFRQPDPDTCDWKTKAVWMNGRLIQKRVGVKGVMFDCRCVVKHHPSLPSSVEGNQDPLLVFKWTLIEPNGKTKHTCKQYMKKIQ